MSEGGLIPLFAEMRPALARYLLARGASAEEAEDLLQETYLKLHADRVGPVAHPRAYLYRTVNNLFLMYRRAAGRRTRREGDWVDSHAASNGELDERPSIETELIAKEQLEILQRILDDLPERSRIIFRRYRIDGEPQRLIAGQFGISLSAVEKHLARAYAAISEAKLRIDEDRVDARHLKGERNRNVS